MAEATIVRIEQGHTVPTFATIRKLAVALGVEPSELVPDPAAFAAARRRGRRRVAETERQVEPAEAR